MSGTNTIRILLTGGGSGGPTAPLLALAEEIRKKNTPRSASFRLLGAGSGAERKMAAESGIAYYAIPAGKLRRYWHWRNLIDPLLVFAGGLAGLLHLLVFRPHLAVSAGSYVSVPVAWLCGLFQIPHMILQMDVHPGLANRLMAPVSRILVCHFEETCHAFPRVPRKHVIGPVVRDGILDAAPENADCLFNLDPLRPVLTVTGGGQGAVSINKAVEGLLELWLPRWQVVHLTGNRNPGWSSNHPEYHRVEFVSAGMGDLLTRSELVVTRAGMGILGELAALGGDALVIPLKNTHQEYNARLLAEKGAIMVLSQDQFAAVDAAWWETFIIEYEPGRLGAKLRSVWQTTGNSTFAELALGCVIEKEN